MVPTKHLAFLLLILLLPLRLWASMESGSLLATVDGKRLYSANFDAGSISVIDAVSGERLLEQLLGGDIRRIALSKDEKLLAASDYLGDRLIFLDAKTLKIKREVAISQRPFGIIYDPHNDWFWVTAFESAQLLAVDRGGRIRQNLETGETPRGLALTTDGRLLVSHAMTGEVSLYDTRKLPVKRITTISLQETQDLDEKVSQGKPRLLDDIAISPDGREAWLPHVLWNFDHPFQFQSTIFPAVSIISLEPGQEQEFQDRRKQLFKQINIQDNTAKTRIVSSPHDLTFSAQGKKVYVTLAASEDLMVIDRSRQLIKKKKKGKKRHRRKKHQGGAKVTQVLRHLPGDNPRGLVRVGNHLFVQNAMSLDMSRLTSGGEDTFARVQVDTPQFAQLVTKDPLPEALRLGKRIFNSGNTDEFNNLPLAGDFWMNCNSCHLDGFNFTNRFLLSTSKQDKHENALAGHANLKGMVAGDFVGDYIRMIQDTQGGMGHDQAGTAKRVNPAAPTQEADRLMKALHSYVTANENLPFVANWLRIAGGGTQVHPKEWVSSVSCRECHTEMFDQWVDSNHHLMADSDPYYKVLEDLAAKLEGEEFRAWCMGCHNPQALTTGAKRTGDNSRLFEQGGASLIAAHDKGEILLEEGTSCIFCHRITKVEDVGGNAGFTFDLTGREHYPFENSNLDPLRWFGENMINSKPARHAESLMNPVYKDPVYCSACHDEFAPGSGAKIVDTFNEWRESSFNNPEDPSKHLSCIDCHMHADPKRIGEDIPGTSTDGGRIKSNVVTHQFTGANHFQVGLRNKKLEQQSIALLKRAAELETTLVDGRVQVRVKNVGAGHHLPTGVADFRELWLEVKVQDADGHTVLESGLLKEDGNLPENVRGFMKVFGDKEGKPVGLAFWRYERLLKDTRIPADAYRDELFELPVDTKFPLRVQTRLLFRVFPQWVTDAVRKHYPELPNPPVLELEKQNVDLKPVT